MINLTSTVANEVQVVQEMVVGRVKVRDFIQERSEMYPRLKAFIEIGIWNHNDADRWQLFGDGPNELHWSQGDGRKESLKKYRQIIQLYWIAFFRVNFAERCGGKLNLQTKRTLKKKFFS